MAKILHLILVCWGFAPQSIHPLQAPARCNCGGNPPADGSSQKPKFAHLSLPSFSWQPQLTALLCGAFSDVDLTFEISARKTCTYVLYWQKSIYLEMCLQTKVLELHQRNYFEKYFIAIVRQSLTMRQFSRSLSANTIFRYSRKLMLSTGFIAYSAQKRYKGDPLHLKAFKKIDILADRSVRRK